MKAENTRIGERQRHKKGWIDRRENHVRDGSEHLSCRRTDLSDVLCKRAGKMYGRRENRIMSRSDELFERAVKVIPGGVNSPVRAYGSVGMTPRFIEGASVHM